MVWYRTSTASSHLQALFFHCFQSFLQGGTSPASLRPNAGKRSKVTAEAFQCVRAVLRARGIWRNHGATPASRSHIAVICSCNKWFLFVTHHNLLFYLLYLLFQGTDMTHWLQPWGPMKYLSKFCPPFWMQYLFIPHSFSFFSFWNIDHHRVLLRSLCSSVIRVSKWL